MTEPFKLLNTTLASIGSLDAIAKIGGLKIAAMAGAMIGATSEGLLVLVDGFISSGSALRSMRVERLGQQRV